MHPVSQKLKLIIAALAAVTTVGAISIFHLPGIAASTVTDICDGTAPDPTGICADNEQVDVYIQPLLNAFYFVIGILAVGFIVFGGIKYITAAGDPSKLTAAKNTVLYAIIGLVVAISAFAITSFIFNQVAGAP